MGLPDCGDRHSRRSLFHFPGGKGLGESAVAGRTLFHRQNSTAAVSVDDRDVEPRATFEKLLVELHVRIDCRQPHDVKPVCHL
jgi:hypothetical protein